MATRRLTIDLGDGAVVHAEVDHERRVGGLASGGHKGDTGDDATGSIDGLLGVMSGIAKATAKSHADLGDKAPTQVDLSFVARYDADGSVVLIRGGAESHFHVKMRFGGKGE